MNIHQLLMIDLAGPSLRPDERAFLKDYVVGGVCLFRRNCESLEQMRALTGELRDICGDDLIIAIDQEGGSVVRALHLPYSPGNMALGAANDAGLTREVAAATARGLKAAGINVNFAPCVDVNNNPDNPVIGERSFGADPQHVARHGVAFVQGLQAEGVAATLKHFPGHGDTDTDSHLDLPRLERSLSDLEATELIPFRAALAAGTACVMSYHGVVRALDTERPATLSAKVMTDFLRNSLGFDGLSFTDALEMKAVAARHSPADAVVMAVQAGIDLAIYDIHGGPLATHEAILRGLETAFAEGRLNPQEIGRSLERRQRLARRFPGRNTEQVWRGGDAALLAEAARRAVVTLGDFEPLRPPQAVSLISTERVLAGAASDPVATPVHLLARALEQKGCKPDLLLYDPAAPDEEKTKLLTGLAPVTLFVSSSRKRMPPEDLGFVRALAKASRQFIHLALWNPYQVLDLPGPALVTFGFRPVSVEAVVDVLLGGASSTNSPIPLATATI